MAEVIDPTEIGRTGHSVDLLRLRLELYRLATAILATRPVAQLIYDELVDRFSHELHWAHELGAMFCRDEVSRILTATAIQGRIFAGMWDGAPPGAWSNTCREIEEGSKGASKPLGRGPLGGMVKPLGLREAFNKIIHCEIINPDIEPVDDLGFFSPQLINPTMYLYGRQTDGRPWRVTLNLLEYVRSLHMALPRSSY